MRAAVLESLQASKLWGLIATPEAKAATLKATRETMQAAGAFGDAPQGAKAV